MDGTELIPIVKQKSYAHSHTIIPRLRHLFCSAIRAQYEYSTIGPITLESSLLFHTVSLIVIYIVFHCCVVLAFCMHCYKCVCVFPCLPLLVRMCLDLRMWFNCFFFFFLFFRLSIYCMYVGVLSVWCG